jgi:gliding motility-associated transport system ATP-binding protein
MPPFVIVADQLVKWYGPRLAVADVSFEVPHGEVMGLLGPNGSGKTTILRILTGYLRPSSGRASVANLDVVDDALAARQRVGYVPEDVPLYDTMRVSEFLVFMARIKGLGGAAVRSAVEAVTERFALAGVTRLQIGKLSRGFRQRVAIAQALLNSPEVLILDEPTNGLDPHQIIETREVIRSLAGTHTVLVSSHVLSEVAKVADRVAILLDGRVLAVHAIRANGAGHRIRLRAGGPTDEVRACLHAVPGVTSVTVERTPGEEPATYSIEATPGARVSEALAAAVIRAGFTLAELGEVSIDLERLFLDLTRSHPVVGR